MRYIVIMIILGCLVGFYFTATNFPLIENTGYEVLEADVYTDDGCRLHYWFYDRGTDYVIVYLHGGPGSNSSAVRTAFGDAFSDKIGSLLFYDQRGSGQSCNSEKEYFTFDTAIKDLKILTSSVIPDKKIILWSHSFGAMVAVANASSSDGVTADAYIFDAPWLNPKLCIESRDKLPEEAFKINSDQSRLMLTFKNQDTNTETAASWYQNEDLENLNFVTILAVIVKPSLVLFGDSDTNVAPGEVEEMKNYLEGEYVEFYQGGHNFLFAYPDEYINTVLFFLKKNDF